MAKWTEEKLKALAELWPTKSGAQIAEILGKSRGAVMGMAGRLGLFGQSKVAYGRKIKASSMPKTRPKTPKKRTRPPKVEIPEPKIASVGDNGVSILDVGYGQCRAIIGNDPAPSYLARFCGRPIKPGTGFSFCADHQEIYVVKGGRNDRGRGYYPSRQRNT